MPSELNLRSQRDLHKEATLPPSQTGRLLPAEPGVVLASQMTSRERSAERVIDSAWRETT